jgi:Tfp pilus assembly protein PilN
MKMSKNEIPTFDPNWHPNFRVTDQLPDLKVVRTDFFVNIATASIAIICVLFLGIREYRATSIQNSISSWEQQIEEDGARNRAYLKMSADFEQGGKKVEEVNRFVTQDIVASSLLIALSKSIPGEIVFTNISLSEKRVNLFGSIRGSSEEASNNLTEYLDVLRENSDIGPHCEDISLTSLHRDEKGSGLQFEITLKRNEEKKGK